MGDLQFWKCAGLRGGMGGAAAFAQSLLRGRAEPGGEIALEYSNVNMRAKSEKAWIAEQRLIVEAYLRRQRIDHLGVGEYPAFFVHPYLALWAIQSKKAPGWIGWWTISGDLPTDYISSSDGRHPREALRAFSRTWDEVSAYMRRGEKHPDCRIGDPEHWPELGELLKPSGRSSLNLCRRRFAVA